jgi:hypothetical protein
MGITGLIPVVAIGSVIGILVAVRDGGSERSPLVCCSPSLAAMAWVYFFVFQ